MLHQPATPGALRKLAQHGVLDADQLTQALNLIDQNGNARWRVFAERTLLVVAAVLGCAAVVFFVAANWSSIGKGERIGLALAAHVIATVAGFWLGTDRLGGRVALAGAAVLVGPALFAYGQAYQTGADAWQLFAGWTLLAVPFAVLARGTAVWSVLLVLMHISVFLAVDQHHDAYGHHRLDVAALLVLCADACLYALARRGGHQQLALIILAAGLWVPAPFVAQAIAHVDRAHFGAHSALLLVGAAAFIAVAMVKSILAARMADVALLSLAAALHVGMLASQLVFKGLDLHEFGLLLMCGAVLVEATLVAVVLRHVWNEVVRRGVKP